MTVVLVEVGALRAGHAVEDVNVRADDVGFRVPRVLELGDFAAAQVLLRAWIRPDCNNVSANETEIGFLAYL